MKATLLRLIQKKSSILFVLTFLISAYIYSQYFANISYPDEFDNFANTWLIVKGLILYKDFFSNHLPTLMILGIPAELINHSALSYRVEVFALYFSFFSVSFIYLKGYLKFSIIPFMIFSAYAISLYGGQQFADGIIWAITLVAAFFIVAKNLGKTLSQKEAATFALLMLATVLSSPMHILGFIMLLIFHVLSQKKQRRTLAKNLINLKVFLLSLAIPIVFLILYLLLTGSLTSFYNATIAYNNDFYYYHLYPNPYIKFHLLDYYLHTTRDLINHLYEIAKNQGPYLVNFLKALKSLIFKPTLIFDANYLRVIFSMLYENFLTFEVFILFFYIFGFLALLKKDKRLAILSLIFTFALRVRINERIHMAPYYLFSYWMLGVAIAIACEQILQKKNVILNSLFLSTIALTTLLFIAKNDYDFRQIAYNRFTYGYEQSVALLKNVDPNQKIIAFTPFSAAYYYLSNHLPSGYFINYYPFFEISPYLSSIWHQDLANYNGNYLIVGENSWTNYCTKKQVDWQNSILTYINNNYELQTYPQTKDFVFKRTQSGIACKP